MFIILMFLLLNFQGAYGTAVLYKKKDDDSLVILKEINLHELNVSERQLAKNEVTSAVLIRCSKTNLLESDLFLAAINSQCTTSTYTCLRKSVRYLPVIFYNLKKSEPVFIIFGMQYPNNPSFKAFIISHQTLSLLTLIYNFSG